MGTARVTVVEAGPAPKVADLHALTLRVDAALAAADAVVVTTSGPALAEVAYWLDLTARSPKPVVVTCRHDDANDGIALAASGATTGFGAVVALGGEVLAAREATLSSGGYGVVGTVDDGRVRVHRAPARAALWTGPGWATPFDLTAVPATALPRVEIVHGYVDASASTVTGPVGAGAGGIVIAGEPSAAQLTAVRAARGVVFAGPGLLDVEDLHPHKARLLLLLALAAAGDPARAARWFAEYAAPAFGARSEDGGPVELLA